MCKPASFVLTKTRAYWSEDGDSHEDIISEHSLHADGPRGPNIVHVEVVPQEENYAAPLDQWQYNVDQDVLPDWYDADAAESMARAALQKWAKQHIIRDHLDEVRDGQTRILLESATVENVIGGWVDAYDSATMKSVRGGWVRACYDSDTAESMARAALQEWAPQHSIRGHLNASAGRVDPHTPDSATVEIRERWRVFAYNSATVGNVSRGRVYAYGSTTVENVSGGDVFARDSATVENVSRGEVCALDSTTVKTVSGGWVDARDSATVENVSGGDVYTHDSATVKNDTRTRGK